MLEQLALLNRKVDDLSRRMTVSERNGVARMENNTVWKRRAPYQREMLIASYDNWVPLLQDRCRIGAVV
ncbi:hypothetical protein GQ602_004726 [Ophiocordyceps camponoti-floridani]|uniref:Uncharacterized protein n=1 Tax=Ophiocordyceps camponoti-floridani TaxID=2030778 RepID=A0A8H4VCD3_9HYPO|nr:hypothetical protein GQ602_004726 [Ophiocordyceps camponoti-floridani]